MNLAEFREKLGDGSDAALLEGVQSLPEGRKILTPAHAKAFLWNLVLHLLETDRYSGAATLLWGSSLFDARPSTVRTIWRTIRNNAFSLLLGAGSLGKSYTVIAFLLLDWIRDPLFTTVKLMSTTAGHARANTFSTLSRLHSHSILKLPGKLQAGFVGVDKSDRHASIALVAIPPGDDGKARLQGFHPTPRPRPDPSFGTHSRVRAFLDEAEEIPDGVWEGVDNLLTASHGPDLVKIIGATNPKDVTSRLATEAEPDKGWTRVDVEEDLEWISRRGWKVIRLDGARCENVQQRAQIFPSLMSLEGYERLRLKGGGNSPEYWTLARGMYPLAGVADAMIPYQLLDSAFGQYVFATHSIAAAGIDLAFEGPDLAKLAIARYGLAIGYRLRDDPTLIKFQKSKWCVQIDQIFDLPKLLTVAQSNQIRIRCEALNVTGDWVCMDRTGNASGVHDALRETWDRDVRGIHWGEEATATKILDEDKHYAIEELDGIVTEMWACLRKYLEFDFVKFAPVLEGTPLIEELTKRRYKIVGKGPTGIPRIRLEKKEEFKNRVGRSPDEADALVSVLHGIRMNGKERANMMLERRAKKRVGQKPDPLSKVKWVNFQDEPHG